MRKLLFIFLFITSYNAAQFLSWEYYGNMKRPVAGGDIWQDVDNFYVFGGYSDSVQANVDWIQKFRVYFDVWKLNNMSAPRFGLVTERYNNYAYLYGGVFDESNSITSMERWGLDITIETFSFSENFNRIFSTGRIVGDNFYIIGGNSLPGTNYDTLPYIIEYNLIDAAITYRTDTLFTSGDLPEQQMSEVVGDDIFIFGGTINGISQDIYKFNTVDYSYEKLDVQLLEPRAGGRAIIGSEPNRIFIIGGYNENSQALNSVEIFTVFGDQYYIEEGPPIQDARYSFMSAYLDGYIYIMGGYSSEGKVIETIERLSEYTATEVEEKSSDVLNHYELYQNYPNPFNPGTTIKYSIPSSVISNSPQPMRNLKDYSSEASRNDNVNVSLKVYDVLGNEVVTLVNEVKQPGNYEVYLDAADFSSGIYYYQLKIGSFILTKKMVLLK